MQIPYGFEIQKAADTIVKELFALQPGESFVITADTQSDEDVANAIARSVYAAGGKPIVMWTATPPGPGRMVDDFLPSDVMRGALLQADCFIEINNMYLLYSALSDYVQKNNKKMRALCLPAMRKDSLKRMFADIDHRTLCEYLDAVRKKIINTIHCRFTSPAGTDVEFNNHPGHPVFSRNGYARTPGVHQLAGMIAWAPDLDSINGVIAVDGSLVPQFGVCEEIVYIHLKTGIIEKVEGGRQARELEAFLRDFKHPQMLRPAHTCCGFHPCAKLTGQIGEDERIWGGTQWGFGNVGVHLIPPNGIPAPSHLDATCLNTSIFLDGEQITDCGTVVDDDLHEKAKALGK